MGKGAGLACSKPNKPPRNDSIANNRERLQKSNKYSEETINEHRNNATLKEPIRVITDSSDSLTHPHNAYVYEKELEKRGLQDHTKQDGVVFVHHEKQEIPKIGNITRASPYFNGQDVYIPKLHKGGYVKKPTNSLYKLAHGELVIPKPRVKAVTKAMAKSHLKPIVNFV